MSSSVPTPPSSPAHAGGPTEVSRSVDPSALLALQRRAVAVLADLAPAAVELGRLFRDAGHELALVGGPVRDAFLGRVSNDLDFATSADPDRTG